MEMLPIKRKEKGLQNLEEEEDVKIKVNEMDSSPSLKCKITLEFKNIKLKLGEKEILKNVSGNFKPGELIGILGPR